MIGYLSADGRTVEDWISGRPEPLMRVISSWPIRAGGFMMRVRARAPEPNLHTGPGWGWTDLVRTGSWSRNEYPTPSIQGDPMKLMLSPERVALLAALRSRIHSETEPLSGEEWGQIRWLEDVFVPPPLRDLAVGTPATYAIGSDRYAGEVVAVRKNGQELWFRHRGDQGEGEPFTYRRTSGRYLAKGSGCGTLLVGTAEDYRDPCF